MIGSNSLLGTDSAVVQFQSAKSQEYDRLEEKHLKRRRKVEFQSAKSQEYDRLIQPVRKPLPFRASVSVGEVSRV